MKRKFGIIALLLAMLMAFAACSKKTDTAKPEDKGNTTAATDEKKDGEKKDGEKTDSENKDNEGEEESANTKVSPEDKEYKKSGEYKQLDLKVGFVTDEGGVNDQSFNQSSLEGLYQAKADFGIDVSYQESHNPSDIAPNLETILDNGAQMIWGAGFKLGDDVHAAAKANPEVKYAILDYAYPDDKKLPNLLGIMFKAEQPSFLVGYIAGLMTETNKVGFIGGVKGNIIDGFDYGFQAGVLYAAKEKGKDIDVLSQYVNNFNDTVKAKAIANTMYSEGRDIIFHAAGGAGDGLIEAAKENKKWAIGVDRDQNYMAPNNVLTSAMKRVDVAIWNVLHDMSEGKEFPGGQNITYDLTSGAVGIAPTSDKNVPKDILEKVDAVSKLIVEGKIEVPFDEASFKTYKANLK